MRRRAFLAGMGCFLTRPFAAQAASSVRRYRVGFLDTAPRERNVNFAAFAQALLDHGYTEGQNLNFEYRSASGRNASFAELAGELVRLEVDVIVTRGTPAALAARSATVTIPVVMAAAGDPVAIAGRQQNMTGFGASPRGAQARRNSQGDAAEYFARRRHHQLVQSFPRGGMAGGRSGRARLSRGAARPRCAHGRRHRAIVRSGAVLRCRRR